MLTRCDGYLLPCTGNLTKLRILNVHSNLITELPIEVQELQEEIGRAHV